MPKAMIAGIDGYLGWSLALHLAHEGYEVSGIDNFSRRNNVAEMGSWSITPILSMPKRIEAAKKLLGYDIKFRHADLLMHAELDLFMGQMKPDVVIHLGEQPSAPFSQIDRQHAFDTQENNVLGSLNLIYAMRDNVPNATLVKLGTMGEYGTPGVTIPEGSFELQYDGQHAIAQFPRDAGSWYHQSKVHDSNNLRFACEKLKWLGATDIMQGVVYGTSTDEMSDPSLLTRFDIDEAFGTAINRFCAEAVIGYPLTTYGQGAQKRGFIALTDSIQCMTLAIKNPPASGEYRVFNQLDEVYSIIELASIVQKAALPIGLNVKIEPLDNPRVEAAEHYYKVEHEKLKRLGFVPTRTLQQELRLMFDDLIQFKSRIEKKKKVIEPKIKWKTGRQGS